MRVHQAIDMGATLTDVDVCGDYIVVAAEGPAGCSACKAGLGKLHFLKIDSSTKKATHLTERTLDTGMVLAPYQRRDGMIVPPFGQSHLKSMNLYLTNTSEFQHLHPNRLLHVRNLGRKEDFHALAPSYFAPKLRSLRDDQRY